MPSAMTLQVTAARLNKALPEHAVMQLGLAHNAFLKLEEWTVAKRASRLRRVAAWLEIERKSFASIITEETGKPIRQSLDEVDRSVELFYYYADWAASFLTSHKIPFSDYGDASAASNPCHITYIPLGLVLLITPWNYPLWQIVRGLVPAVMAGNSVVVKASDRTPKTTRSIIDLFSMCDLPEGTVQRLSIGIGQVEAAIADSRIDFVSFTGSEAVGRLIASASGRALKPHSLELGGSDPMIIMPSADIDQAARAAAASRVKNGGQSCTAVKRLIVHHAVYEKTRNILVEIFGSIRAGDPSDMDTDLGPLVSEVARKKIASQVRSAIKAGANLAPGSQIKDGPGSYYGPIVIENVPPDNPLLTEEVFAPVLVLIKAQDIDCAIAVANRSRYGLCSTIWTRNPAEQERAISAIKTGTTFINTMPSTRMHNPFGGINCSGYGKELGAAGIRNFCNAKTVVEG